MTGSAVVNIPARLTSISGAIGAAVGLTGFAVVCSWLIRLPGLRAVHPVLGTMSSHAAVCLGLSGVGLFFSKAEQAHPWHAWVARACASLVIAISALTLSDSFGWGIGIGHFTQGAIGQMLPGRLPVATAIAFLALGAALLFLDVEVSRRRPAEFLSFAAALISLLALIAYSYSFVSVFDVARRRPLAFHTILLLLMLSFGILAARPQAGVMRLATGTSIGSIMVRRMLPAAVGIPVLVGWLIMEGQRGGLYPPALNLPYFALCIIVVFSTLIGLTARSLHRMDLERQEAEEQVRRLNAELEQRVIERTAQLESANHELESFSYSVSHDLRAPLRAIDGFSRMLLEDYSAVLGPEGQNHLQRVCGATQRMGQLIDDLLNLSRLARQPMNRRRVDLSAMASEIVAELRRSDPDHQVHISVNAGLHVEADPSLIRVVLENLLGNAWKFTRKTANPRVDVAGYLKDGRTTVFIRDNGAGFDMKYADKLFGAFQRLHAATDFDGTGIGLATVQRIIHRHGGRVWAEGAVAQGATFSFTV